MTEALQPAALLGAPLAWLALLVLAAVTAGALELLRRLLLRRRLLDRPNERSSHKVPVPRGAGLALVPLALAATWLFGWLFPNGAGTTPLLIGAAALGLALLSWLDDLKDLPAGPRFALQALAVGLGLALLPGEARVFQGWLPFWPDRVVAGLAWLWFVNLTNFMDGIDGITGIEGLVVAAGLLLFADLLAPALPWALIGVLAGFLVLNWAPARIFLGDVGSVPLGYGLGWCLLLLAAGGEWAAALILPAYYWADATLTLLRRAAKGEKLWQAHRSHFYQRASRGWGGHAPVSAAIGGLGVALIALAAWSRAAPWSAAAVAALLTLATLAWFERVGRRAVVDSPS